MVNIHNIKLALEENHTKIPDNIYRSKSNHNDVFRVDVPFVTDWLELATEPRYLWAQSIIWDLVKPKDYLVIGALLGISESYSCWRTGHYPNKIVVADVDLGAYNPDRNNLASVYKNIGKYYPPPQELIITRSNSQTSATCEDLGPYDLIFIDGDHSEKGVMCDMERAFRSIRDGGIIMVHDVDPPEGKDGGLAGVITGFSKWVNANKDKVNYITIPGKIFQQGLGLIQKK